MTLEEYREYSKKNDGMTIVDWHGNELYNPLYDLDEGSLSKTERLGVAWCRLAEWKWDKFVGPKPIGFDDLPKFDVYSLERIRHPLIMRILSKMFPNKYEKRTTKEDFIHPAIKKIESEIGLENALRCHWIYGMMKTEDEFREWWNNEHIKGLDC